MIINANRDILFYKQYTESQIVFAVLKQIKRDGNVWVTKGVYLFSILFIFFHSCKTLITNHLDRHTLITCFFSFQWYRSNWWTYSVYGYIERLIKILTKWVSYQNNQWNRSIISITWSYQESYHILLCIFI